MKAQKLKKQKNTSKKKLIVQKKISLSGFLQQETSQLENYKSFFQYLISSDTDNELADG